LVNGLYLKNDIEYGGILGNKFIIKIQTTFNPEKSLLIQIDYQTSPNSPALYWLTPNQTSDGTHPLLISNTKVNYK